MSNQTELTRLKAEMDAAHAAYAAAWAEMDAAWAARAAWDAACDAAWAAHAAYAAARAAWIETCAV